ncbi:esterase [Sphingobacteriales bacterium UPWRP_1]|nr:hypothetical protein B6N25_05370 [Sphingobacteriales bacterium TSM_CSS]PSJ72780.1 esterase [Sphingobacteriales bacterium UPWRP_1]
MDNHKYGKTYRVEKVIDFWSDALERYVVMDIYLPPGFEPHHHNCPLLLFNDGQDGEGVHLLHHLNRLTADAAITAPLAVGVYAGERIQEYGVAAQPDYKNRGSKAGAYSRFVMEELIPQLTGLYHINTRHSKNTISGFSLGGLSAFDIAWNNAGVFKQVGVFSGAFWWRSEPVNDHEPDAHRIMHEEVRKAPFKPDLRFWFQSGSLDEEEDRNNNGVIDVIDDILDLSVELVCKGYRPFYDIAYLEIANGQHNLPTWGKAMPWFLKWAFGHKPVHSVTL